MKKFSILIYTGVIAFMCSSCATIFCGTKQKVTFYSEPLGARVSERNGKVVCVTSGIVKVKRALMDDGRHYLSFKMIDVMTARIEKQKTAVAPKSLNDMINIVTETVSEMFRKK